MRAFAKEFGLTVDKDTPKPERRTIKLSGTVAAMQKAFGVTLTQKILDGTPIASAKAVSICPPS